MFSNFSRSAAANERPCSSPSSASAPANTPSNMLSTQWMVSPWLALQIANGTVAGISNA